MTTTPNSFDNELDEILENFKIDCVDYGNVGRFPPGHIQLDVKRAISKLYLTHRNAELEKLLEQKVENMQTTDDRFIDAVPVSAIKDLMRGNDV